MAPDAPRLGHRLLVAAALMHLCSVVAFTSSGLAENAPGRIGEILRIYQNLSGSFQDYTFFAPTVASDVKAGFLLEDIGSGVSLVTFQARNREIAFRYNSIVASCMRDGKGRDLFAQSWAALMLGSRPGAVSVTVSAVGVPWILDRRERLQSRPPGFAVTRGEA